MSVQVKVDQVLTVCPHVNIEDVIRDLNCTGDAEATINRILDGTFQEGSSPTRVLESLSPHLPENTKPTPEVDIDSDDELPDIGITCRTSAIHGTDCGIPSATAFGGIIDSKNSDDLADCNNHRTHSPIALPCFASSLDGTVNKWIQQSQLSKVTKHKSSSEKFERSSSGSDILDYNTSMKKGDTVKHFDGITKRGRRISISSSEDEVGSVTKKKMPKKSDILHVRVGTYQPCSTIGNKSDSPVDMNRACSPISVSDSDDDQELLTLSVKHGLQSTSYPPDNASSQSTMYSMDCDMQTTDSSTPQTGETHSSVGSTCSSAWSTATDSQEPLKRKKRKRTPEEIEEAKRQALEKKLQRELAKETKRKEKEKAIEEKKALHAARKADRPEECMKYVRVTIDPVLLEEVGDAAILAKLESMDCKSTIESQAIPAMVTWKRLGSGHNLGEDLQLQSMCTELDECEALVLLPTSSFIDLVYIFKQEQQGSYTGMESLRTHTQTIQRIIPGKHLTYIVMNMEKYFRHQKTSNNRQFRSAVLGNQENDGKTKRRKKGVEEIILCVSRVDVEEALVDLQLHMNCNMKFAEKPEEVAEFIALFTKSVAETPFKRERDKATFTFHVDNEWAAGIRVSKDGVGLLRVWRQQLQQFRNVSQEIAFAIIDVYPAPRLLLQAYNRCTSVSQAQKLLQDIRIRRGEGVLATSRRVGGVLSKRIHTLLTSHDGELVL